MYSGIERLWLRWNGLDVGIIDGRKWSGSLGQCKDLSARFGKTTYTCRRGIRKGGVKFE